MTWKMAAVDVDHTRRFQTVWTSTRRDVLDGLGFVVVVAAVLGAVVGESSHDVFASTEHLRLLADSERTLVTAVQRYVDSERQRLHDIVKYDHGCHP